MTKATEKELSELHSVVASAFASALQSKTRAASLLAEYEADLPQEVVDFLRGLDDPSPALLSAATKFLKDNNITCPIEDSPDLSEVEKALAEKRKQRVGNIIPFDAEL